MRILQRFGFRESAYERPTQKWVCGRMAAGLPCRVGPDGRGRCQADFECVPAKSGDTWLCRRPESAGGPCEAGPGPDGTCCRAIPPCAPTLSLAARRARVVRWFVAVAIGIVALAVSYPIDSSVLSPGPMTASHATLTNCASCHSNVPEEQFGWLHTIFAKVSPTETSAACLACHTMERKVALNPHGAALDELESRTQRLRATASAVATPVSLQLRNAVFPSQSNGENATFCTTCHQEHKGEGADLTAVSNDQCQGCHAVQFTSFQTGHPKIEQYPFDRRTRLIFDHNSHFKTHFPKKAAETPVSQSVFGERTTSDRLGRCSNCHEAGPENRHMVVKPFEQVCASCHLDQIVGKEATGPAGVPLFSLPGLDLDTLRERKAEIGEWPETAIDLDVKPSPLMKLLLGADAEGRALMSRITKKRKPDQDGEQPAEKPLDIQDLSDASDEDIETVVSFVWKIKELLHTLSSKSISESHLVTTFAKELGREGIDHPLLASLAGSIPRDVWVGAQRDWLPNLGDEIARRNAGEPVPIPEQAPQCIEPAKAAANPTDTNDTDGDGDNTLPIDEGGDDLEGNDDTSLFEDDDAESTDDDTSLFEDDEAESSTDDTSLFQDDDAESSADDTSLFEDDDAESSADDTSLFEDDDAESSADDTSLFEDDDAESSTDDTSLFEDDDAESSDDDASLFEEADGENSDDADLLTTDNGSTENGDPDSQTDAVTEIDTADLKNFMHCSPQQELVDEGTEDEEAENAVDAEQWAEFGGWYRQGFEIRYKPTRHADQFVRAWVNFSSHLSDKVYSDLAQPVFALLTKSDAPGQCSSCHSIDARGANGLRMNWEPFSPGDTLGDFTKFSHQPHFSIRDERGCLTCHAIEPAAKYQASFEGHDPAVFQSNFMPVDEQLCKSCHTEANAGQDCQLCHVYHVTDIKTETMAATTGNE